MPRIAALPTSQPASSRPARLAQSPATDRAPRKRPGFPEPLKSAKRTCNVRPQYSPCQDVATTASATSSVTARTNIAALTGGISHISTLSSLAPLRGDCSAARRARVPPGPVVTVRFARCERPARRLRGLPSEHRRYYRGSRRAWETFRGLGRLFRALGRVVSGRFAQNRSLRSAPKTWLTLPKQNCAA